MPGRAGELALVSQEQMSFHGLAFRAKCLCQKVGDLTVEMVHRLEKDAIVKVSDL